MREAITFAVVGHLGGIIVVGILVLFLPLTARRFPPTILIGIGERHFSDVGDHLREFGF